LSTLDRGVLEEVGQGVKLSLMPQGVEHVTERPTPVGYPGETIFDAARR